MEGGKKIIAAVVLIVVIIVAVVVILRRSGMVGGPTPPAWVLDQQIEKIDAKTMETVTLKLREWEKLGHKEGKYKNPKTGEYTMVSPFVCAACQAKIPAPDLGIKDTPEKPADPEEIRKAQAAYKCPKCNKSPFPEVSGSPEMPPR